MVFAAVANVPENLRTHHAVTGHRRPPIVEMIAREIDTAAQEILGAEILPDFYT